MAFAYSDTTLHSSTTALVCEVRASDVGASDLIPVQVRSEVGVISRWEVHLLSGAGATVDPTIYADVSASNSWVVVDWTGTAAADVASVLPQPYFAPGSVLYVKAAPNAGANNVVLVRIFITPRS